ncbi:HNH endonuclease (plasmid) [Pseudoalteromonas piscicida]|uniref:HNH endonuclease signature motif containing protein n=1 Tax=Pseudoalteromonas piscicida TaxID=43662 RepID=UPI001D0A8BAD|nr:HNH endonuclease [Pseudoalteromonas piscicida]UDM64209.1 HNH endonuclease [Pseudoalteromonas piscicida]
MSSSWHYDLLLPDAAIEGMQATVKRLDDVTPKIDQHMQQAAQEIGQRVNKALDEYQGQPPIRGVTDKPTKAKADELEPPKGNELPGTGTTQTDKTKPKLTNRKDNKLQLIDGKPPRNAEFAGQNYSLDIHKNTILKQRLDAMQPRKRKIRELKLKELAEKYPDGVNFTEKGFADFRPYIMKYKGYLVEVDIKKLNPDPTSGRGTSGSQLDMRNANQLMENIDPAWKQPSTHTWHHVENSTKLQLIPSDLHSTVGHSGGRNTYSF